MGKRGTNELRNDPRLTCSHVDQNNISPQLGLLFYSLLLSAENSRPRYRFRTFRPELNDVATCVVPPYQPARARF